MGTPLIPNKSKYEIVPPNGGGNKYEVTPPSGSTGQQQIIDNLRSQNAKNDLQFGGGGHEIKAKPPLLSVPGIKSALYEGADRLTNALPAVGGIGGGMIGGAAGSAVPGAGNVAGAVAGAGIGGAAGESARQLSRRIIFPSSESPQSSSEAAEGIGTEGVKQAAYELGGQAFGRAGKAIAPKLAEAAVAPGKRLLKSVPEDVNIGGTILKETKGYSPATIAKELDTKIAGHSADLETKLAQAGQRGVRVPILPARQEAAAAVNDAVQKNAPNYIKDAGKVSDQLTHQYDATGSVVGNLPADVQPLRARNLRQGVDLTIGNWNPENAGIGEGLRKRIYGKITDGIHSAVPGSAEHDAAMTQMIPAKQAAWNTSFTPGITRNVVERVARPTGALVGSIAGGTAGYKEGGLPGAVAGGTAGLLLGPLATGPTGLMIGARLADRAPGVGRVLRGATALTETQLKNKRAGESEGGKRD
jgi:hypothetical protein